MVSRHFCEGLYGCEGTPRCLHFATKKTLVKKQCLYVNVLAGFNGSFAAKEMNPELTIAFAKHLNEFRAF